MPLIGAQALANVIMLLSCCSNKQVFIVPKGSGSHSKRFDNRTK